MIITAQEYRDMGFSAEDDALLQQCLQRAEYTIGGLTEGRHRDALAAGGMAAEYVKQAAAFQTCKLLREQDRASGGVTERVSVGDYSYQTSYEKGADADADGAVFDMNMQAVRLLKAAGCLFSGREVRRWR